MDLKDDDDQVIDPLSPDIGLHSAPIIADNVIVIGAAHKPGGVPKSKTNVKGYVRGFDAKTGRRLWTFHTIPKPGEFGIDTWEQDSWSYTGNTGSWGQASIDPDLNTVYIGVEMPTGDYYGGHRPGNNLFSESIVALDLHTGVTEVALPIHSSRHLGYGQSVPADSGRYHDQRTDGEGRGPAHQTGVHVRSQPGDGSSRSGRSWNGPWRKALYPASGIRRPSRSRPSRPAFAPQGVSIDDLIDFTPELRAEAVKLVARYKIGPMYTPPVVSNPRGPLATLTRSTAGGGANWPGGSYDPETHIAYVSAQTVVQPIGLLPPTNGRSDMNFISGQAQYESMPGPPDSTAGEGGGGGRGGTNIKGLPLTKPPYGTITAIDLNKRRNPLAGGARRHAGRYPQ